MSLDTVKHAAGTPDAEQPWAELGLKQDEYARIREILGRRPTGAELAMYSVMWSEHCSYKSSKVHLRQFGEKAPENDAMLVGIGENAGVVDVGQGYAVTFKVESHNHPSYIEPYQGAATGVGGIVRDILAMGARPVAVVDPLRFGAADHPDTRRVLPGVVAGIGGYGNCLGLPNIGGEVVFDPCYQGNPLVNAGCIGVMKHEDIHLAQASGPGNKVILYGARTGGDGIGGVSVLASETFDSTGPAKRPAVQVGDPFQEKLLIECTLEIFREKLVAGIQDLGGAGLSCATSELASAGSGGMHIDLDTVPLRDATLSPEEILMSESQERMCAIVEPGKVDRFLEICEKWDVIATVIGEVTEGERLEIFWHGEQIVDVPPRTVAHEGPVYERPYARPAWQDALQADDAGALPRPADSAELRAQVLRLLSSPNQASKAWITDQYDRFVQGNTVLAQPEDAGMVRIDEETNLGVAMATDGNGRYAKLDPYAGAQLALAEAYRNVAASGARPLAVSDCLNFGSPEDPGVMWQFAEATRGLADACLHLGTPVTGGNVSLYNQTGETAIHPTPVVAVLGVIDDVNRRTPIGFAEEGQLLYLLGDTKEEFGGSAWSQVVHDHLGGLPPAVDLDREKLLAEILISASRDGMIDAAHDLSDGGLVQAVLESALRGGHGARLVVPDGLSAFTFLFSESAGRAVVSVPRSEELRFTDMCGARGLPVTRIGVVDGDALEVQGEFTIPLDEARTAYEGTIPALLA
ncbi:MULTISPECIES: phosphoribosylformylglycinamidine synthase subunit PurL [Streptomyces]|uniref:Phosphoribosylformylglycinamidine synthase subunit PurL n=1 Tax=Streptomyces tsukubensis (strain DSM 42081 / NBRC 108919 / NRRL 18488 / 9993) TaxID=1114943 RepID=I2N1J1_STRT9|nr:MULTISPECIES: phosphoribosylformylglycinamidine synthase subunit PurL [Streptomyces]AZK95047.1 phosphoribosylformylglycinamidine synthase II [Streptomyces tsukubensis]EIF90888.1 phosphoribosylformylglycinamidine synthase II [Streptomyces tsukubensis NRRL18488]MYS63182.1 phosphoribosylformylglycinamidine synthase subunit PurL [Streptomyces sp. SID5473]QKM68885.1 phosphoribosylformylglycinamidine synthase subunit PurL [Streptomyces tsukubensis NRRL18488]TAI43689.1 phosphoribosylformylglycinam